MSYVVDSHALGSYLLDQLPSRAQSIFREAEGGTASLIIPSIAIAEIIYVLEKARLNSLIWEMFDKLDEYTSFSVCPLDEAILKLVPQIHLGELHDRIIVATCKHTNARALVTKDREIRASRLVETIY